MVELALGFSLFWAMFTGVYQIGYAYYVYNSLLTSVANAAELAAKLSYDTGDAGTAGVYQTAVKNMVVYGDETAGTKPIVPGLTTANVNVTMNPATGTPQDVTVSITGYSINSIFTTYALTNKPRATSLYYGTITCSANCP
jgi:hypothetical protein